MEFCYKTLGDLAQIGSAIINEPISKITAGHYSFSFKGISQAQSIDLVNKLMARKDYFGKYDIMRIVRCCHALNIPVELRFHALEYESMQENLEEYAMVFLPIYKRLRKGRHITNI